MDPWDSNNSLIDHHRLRNRRDHRHPSFSSTLLDKIYRSIDDSSTNSDVSMRKNQNRAAASLDENRVCLEKILVNRRVIADDFVRSRNPKTAESVFFKHSSSSSSDSSGLSSSESDSFYRRSRSSRSPPAICHPKPIRTTTVERFERSPQVHRPNNKQEHGSFLRTKSKALKIYSDLKKVKQPISPGGRLATFLNSIFTGAGNTKKPPNKINTTAVPAANATSSSTCSSASSFSRSCLSKTPSSSEKSKRSVRFCPVNVILDEESKRSGHNNNYKLYGNNERECNRHHKNFDALEIRVREENRRVIEAAKELLRNYQMNKDVVVNISGQGEEDDDDAASCASSDLFELDNLSAIGIERYREELPVYETTRLNTNPIISR